MILWFRNDLRTHDNPALHHFMNTPCSSHSRKAFFFISKQQWQSHDWSLIKSDFVIRHAKALVKELASLNIDLELVNVANFAAQIAFLKDYCLQHEIQCVFANSEVEFNEQERDSLCIEQGIPLKLFEADVIVPKGKVLNQSGAMFKVFTPFKKAWLKHVKQFGFEYLGKLETNPCKNVNNKQTHSLSSSWPLAHDYETNEWPIFIQDKITEYAEQRDIPSIKGTSGISPYLAAGVISPRFLLMSLLNRFPDLLVATDTKYFSWLNEIIWREFYRHLLFHEQRLSKHECFNQK